MGSILNQGAYTVIAQPFVGWAPSGEAWSMQAAYDPWKPGQQWVKRVSCYSDFCRLVSADSQADEVYFFLMEKLDSSHKRVFLSNLHLSSSYTKLKRA